MISHTKQGTLGSASCDRTHAGQRIRFVTGIEFCSDITHKIGGTIFSGHWDLPLVISHTKQGLRFVTGMGVSDEVRGTICYGHWVLRGTRDRICYGH